MSGIPLKAGPLERGSTVDVLEKFFMTIFFSHRGNEGRKFSKTISSFIGGMREKNFSRQFLLSLGE